MSLDAALNKAVSSIPECVAAGYVDVASGMLLAIKTVDSHPREVVDLVAAATADLFNGPNVSMIERLFKKARKKAAKIGANGLLVQRIKEPNTGDKVAHALIGTEAKRRGEMVAIYVKRPRGTGGVGK